ncbi:dopamine D2-like receptor [Penaeus monodon]|uniref:dopamine D2-like receptor n=1 Tax=Penaeus monodon TaxID=6687 RepID=UPI0018A79194|nr:dopamine D2-like receptor [Penaeus monodon]
MNWKTSWGSSKFLPTWFSIEWRNPSGVGLGLFDAPLECETTTAHTLACVEQSVQLQKFDMISLYGTHRLIKCLVAAFLLCWVPFFTCNIIDAISKKTENSNLQPGMTAFVLTTWIGYMNSFLNPVIYTIFNPEFRKAFKKILVCQS